MINEEGLRDWFGKSKSKDGKKGWVNVVTGGTCASDEPGEGTPKCVSSAKRASMTKAERLSASRRKKKADPGQQQKSGAAKPTYVKTDSPRKMKEETFNEARKPGETPQAYADRMKKKYSGDKSKTYDPMKDPNFDHDKAERTRGSMQEAKDKPGKGSGKKDACYHKVKSRYSVWPSAYASGALVKCRKKGAANWGNSTKKEEYMALPEMTEIQINAMRKAGIEVEVVNEDCWDGYEKKGMKTMFGKRYPNCVKKKKTKKEEVELTAEGKADGDPCWDTHKQVGMKKKGGKMVPNCVPKEEVETVEEAVRIPSKTGNIYLVGFSWRGKYMMMKLFFPEVKRPTRDEVQSALDGIYPGCNVMRYDMTPYQPGEQLLHVEESEIEEGAAWTKKEGKNKSGGLNEKGRKSYERENPGSDLKAPSKKVGNPRRASFCARMKGMKKKLTSKKTASDPDSRINKSLRAWNC